MRCDSSPVTTRATSSSVGPEAMKSAMMASSRRETASTSCPGFTSTVTWNRPMRWNDSTPALTETALWSPRTSSLSRRELARPPSTVPATSRSAADASSMPGTTQARYRRVFETRSFSVRSILSGMVGTSASAGWFWGPRGMWPK